MATSSTFKLTRSLYKGLLRAAERLDSSPAANIGGSIRLIEGFPVPPQVDVGRHTSLAAVVRTAFRTSSGSSALDAGLSSLAMANTLIKRLESRSPAVPTETPTSEVTPFTFHVGQSFRHKILGYRAVIIGQDATCRASEKWQAATGVHRLAKGAAQPFYTALVDVRDRPDAPVTYVAQEHIEILPRVAEEAGTVLELAAVADRMVVHPLVRRYFAV